MEKQYINGHMTSICFFSWLSLDTGLHNMWGKSFWTILGVADFKIEITVICVLNLTVTLWLNGKKKSLFHWWSYQTRPYISLTACFRDTRALVKGILLFILQSREIHYFNAVFQILPGSRHCFQFFFFFFSPKTCSDFTWNKTLSNQPDIICLGLCCQGEETQPLEGGWVPPLTASDAVN